MSGCFALTYVGLLAVRAFADVPNTLDVGAGSYTGLSRASERVAYRGFSTAPPRAAADDALDRMATAKRAMARATAPRPATMAAVMAVLLLPPDAEGGTPPVSRRAPTFALLVADVVSADASVTAAVV